jgi:hypothetical protein
MADAAQRRALQMPKLHGGDISGTRTVAGSFAIWW